MPVDFRASLDAQAAFAAVRDILGREGGLDVATAAAADGTGLSRPLWERLAAAGFAALALDGELGGGGAGLEVACEAQRAYGQALAPVPVTTSGFLAPAVAGAGAAGLALRFAEGRSIAAVDLEELFSERPPARADVTIGDGTVGGTVRALPHARSADVALVRAAGAVVLVDLTGEGVERTPVGDLASRGLADVRLDRAPLLARATADPHELATVTTCLQASLAVGAAEGALALAVAYAGTRTQFGQPIGSFQAIQHRLADAATETEAARLLCGVASRAVDVEDPQAGALARVAWTIASGTAVAVARSALQVFGGYGFTLEYPVHLYYRASKALEVSLPGELRARTADFRVLSRPAFTAVGGPAG